MQRAVAFPVTPAVIGSLQVSSAEVFYQTKPPQVLDGDVAGGRSQLHALRLDTVQDRVVLDDLDSYKLAANGTKVAFLRNGMWRIASTAAGATKDDAPLDLSQLTATVGPQREWAEMFEMRGGSIAMFSSAE